jgi:hypothetical protein
MNWPIKYGSYPNLGTIGIPDDAISSVKIAPFTRVILYTDTGLRGQQLVLDGPAQIPDLARVTDSGGNWDDRTSSLAVISTPPTPQQISSCCLGTATSYDCGQYVAGSQVCTEALRGYCTGTNSVGGKVGAPNMNLPTCQSWCKLNPTICDSAAIDYCSTPQGSITQLGGPGGSGTAFCSCLNSPAVSKNIINPKCADRKCIDTGYLTTNMQQANCPNIIDCSIQANLANSGVEIARSVAIDQSCGNAPGATTTSTTNTPTPTNTTSPNTVTILVFLAVFILLVVLGYFGYTWYTRNHSRVSTRK